MKVCALGAAAALMAAPILFAGNAAAADTVIFVPGTTLVGTPAPMTDASFGGEYAGDNLETLDYPASAWPFTPTKPTLGQSVQDGANMLDAVLNSTGDPATVIGISQGALVVDRLESEGIAPAGTTFVVMGDPTRPGGLFYSNLPVGTTIPIFNYTTAPVPSTYNTVVVIQEYDGVADWPDQPWDLIADANAILGIVYLHARFDPAVATAYASVPTSNPISVTTNPNGSTTTTYLLPTPNLPLLDPLRQLGVPAPIVDVLNTALTPIVNAGYSRNHTSTAVPPSTTTTNPPKVSVSAPLKATDAPKGTPVVSAPQLNVSAAAPKHSIAVSQPSEKFAPHTTAAHTTEYHGRTSR